MRSDLDYTAHEEFLSIQEISINFGTTNRAVNHTIKFYVPDF